MNAWILQHFLNPAYFWPGMALLSLPIIIHLINRLRYRRVRFAAMEFLLASEKRNRRRILLEQLLLLMLRVAVILLIVAMIGRLIIDPEQISLFQGAKSHHVILLDDTASMQDRDGEEIVFESAKDVVRRIIAEGARRPGSQLLTLILMSAPEQTVSGLNQRPVDDTLLAEVRDRLDTLTCTHQTADPADALEAARQRLAEDRSALRFVHVLSDFRKSDWIDNKGAASLLGSLGKADVGINLVRCVAEGHENLGIIHLGGAVEVAAAGVPVAMEATVRNWGTRDQENVTAALFVDGVRLPRVIDFQTVSAGEEVTRTFDVVFEKPEPHSVRLSLSEDALDADNARHLAVDVPVDNPVLIVDGSPGAEQGLYIADALAADRSVTGFAPAIQSAEDLRRTALEQYHLIYLVNVAELAPDAVAALETYVENGGGLIWYLGDAVRPAFYNETLFGPERSLFPVRLGLAPEQLERPEGGTSTGPDLVPEQNNPLFRLFSDAEVPVLDLVFVNLFYPRAADDESANVTKDASVVARLRGGAPLMFEHAYGKGRVFTSLTSAGPLKNPEGVVWTNWASGPASFSFVVFQLELAKRLVRKDRTLPQLDSGNAIDLAFNQAVYQPEVEIRTPDDQVSRIRATHQGADDDRNETESAPQARLLYRETDRPGVYALTLTTQDQQQERRLYAVNVPPREGALEVMDDDALLRELGDEVRVEIQPAGSFEWIRSESPGSEVRWFLLVLLALVCISEQLIASRLSYRPD